MLDGRRVDRDGRHDRADGGPRRRLAAGLFAVSLSGAALSGAVDGAIYGVVPGAFVGLNVL